MKSIIYNLPTDDIQANVANILRKVKRSVSNITRKERLALQELKKGPDIIVFLQQTKATVVMNTLNYRMKIKTLLSNET